MLVQPASTGRRRRPNKVIEKRREQQTVEYGPPEEPCKEEKPVCLGDKNITLDREPIGDRCDLQNYLVK